MKIIKKIINIICWIISTTFVALSVAFLGSVWYSAAMKRIGEIGFSAAFWEVFTVMGVIAATACVVFVVALVWDWSGKD